VTTPPHEAGAGIQVYGDGRNLGSTLGSGVAAAPSSNFAGLSALPPLSVNLDSESERNVGARAPPARYEAGQAAEAKFLADREKDREIQKLHEELAFLKRDRVTSPALLGQAQYDKVMDGLMREIFFKNENLVALEAENEKVRVSK
jgi:hypothetical protein